MSCRATPRLRHVAAHLAAATEPTELPGASFRIEVLSAHGVEATVVRRLMCRIIWRPAPTHYTGPDRRASCG